MRWLRSSVAFAFARRGSAAGLLAPRRHQKASPMEKWKINRLSSVLPDDQPRDPLSGTMIERPVLSCSAVTTPS
jgi:hypothetical protein